MREIHAGLGLSGKVEVYSAVSAALEAVAGDAVPGERVLVVGSFITVGEAMSWFDIHQEASAATPGKDD
jgi:folylpolyglutamate synthase/dihydropteroate synthase